MLAKSSAGALGLMQIMPTTASWIAKELEIEDYSVDLLFAPNINIEMGCFYLGYLFQNTKINTRSSLLTTLVRG